MKRIAFILTLLSSLGVARLMSAEVIGKVTDQQGRPLEGVSVITNVTGVGTMSDADGRFHLICPDEVKSVTFSSVGYQARQFKIGEIPTPVILSMVYYRAQDVVVRADRAEAGVTPVTFSNFTRDDIARDYKIGEFPLLLETTPNLYAYSDGGGALGYSYMSIRGFNDKRISTYINGVPLNDPEDQATYFVDLPDFASSVTDIQVQRGVGNSLYGDASFGGSVNIVTNAFAREKQVRLTSGYGQYRSGGERVGETSKQSVEFASGLVDGRWNFTGRYSRQKSDGYRRDSWYEGWAYYLSIARLDRRSTTELHLYGGPMRMHLAYYGAAPEDIAQDRRVNYLDYGNETDNFNQPHYQLHHVYKLSDRAVVSNTLYYIRGKGYYEQLKPDGDYRMYDINPPYRDPADTIGNLVRQQWVQKSQYGWNPRLDIEHRRGTHSIGGSFYYFDSDHWGQVVWAEHVRSPLDPRYRYYHYFGKKYVGSIYGTETYAMTEKLRGQATAQIRYQRYKFDQVRTGEFPGYRYDLDWFFFSPRLGLNYAFDPYTSAYISAAVSSRTPTDAEIYDAGDAEAVPMLDVKSEQVVDLELGGIYRRERFALGANLFWMDFRNEIVPFGGINPNTGLLITVNADRSVHSGIEFTGRVAAVKDLDISGNLSLNHNQVKKYSALFPYATDAGDSLQAISFRNKLISGFPKYLANLVVDYHDRRVRATWRTRIVGKQYVELYNLDEWAIKPYTVSSVSLSYGLADVAGVGKVRLSATVDNLFNKEFIASGYGGNYVNWDEASGAFSVGGWGEYFVAAERSFFVQLEMELF